MGKIWTGSAASRKKQTHRKWPSIEKLTSTEKWTSALSPTFQRKPKLNENSYAELRSHGLMKVRPGAQRQLLQRSTITLTSRTLPENTPAHPSPQLLQSWIRTRTLTAWICWCLQWRLFNREWCLLCFWLWILVFNWWTTHMLNVSDGARGPDAQATASTRLYAMWTYCFFHRGPLCPWNFSNLWVGKIYLHRDRKMKKTRKR